MKNLRSIRIEEGYTQAKVSELLNISQQTYSDYENNKTEPNYETLLKIAELFNVSTDYLLGRTDELGSVVMPSAPAMGEGERELLRLFRALPPEYQELALTNLRTWTGEGKQSQKKKA